MFKIIKFISSLILVDSQFTLPGSQTDNHHCVLDGGYTWCESLNKCHRSWIEDCPETVDMIDECIGVVCSSEIPCPYMPPGPGCSYIPPPPTNCGCEFSGCGTIDCSSNQRVATLGETCGGYMMPEEAIGVCGENLECVNNNGPYVVDAPGTCLAICNNIRDQWGNCVEQGCSNWYDGCNTCNIDEGIITCSERLCYTVTPGSSECRDFEHPQISEPGTSNSIPKNCVTWYDGCNTCSILNGEIAGCTMMMCFTNNIPYCQAFSRGNLEVGEICYRFCEDNSQTYIDRQSDCPDGSICSSNQLDMVVSDSCGSRAHTCISNKDGH